jgi:hypothetical protein
MPAAPWWRVAGPRTSLRTIAGRVSATCCATKLPME